MQEAQAIVPFARRFFARLRRDHSRIPEARGILSPYQQDLAHPERIISRAHALGGVLALRYRASAIVRALQHNLQQFQRSTESHARRDERAVVHAWRSSDGFELLSQWVCIRTRRVE